MERLISIPLWQVWGASWEMPVSPQPPLSVRVTDSAGNKVRPLWLDREPLSTSGIRL